MKCHISVCRTVALVNSVSSKIQLVSVTNLVSAVPNLFFVKLIPNLCQRC